MSRPTFNLGQFLDKEKLKTNGSNFTESQRNLRILIGPAKMSYVLDTVIGDAPAADASKEEKNVHQSKLDDESIVQSGMLYAMEAELQKRYEKMSAHEMIIYLTAVFALQARAKRYEASNLFFFAKMEEHNSVSEHVVKMSGYVQRLKTLEYQIPDELTIDRVVQSMPLATSNSC